MTELEWHESQKSKALNKDVQKSFEQKQQISNPNRDMHLFKWPDKLAVIQMESLMEGRAQISSTEEMLSTTRY